MNLLFKQEPFWSDGAAFINHPRTIIEDCLRQTGMNRQLRWGNEVE